MAKFSVNFIKTARDYGYWELYADDARIGTFSVREIAGLHISNPTSIRLISSARFGEIITGAATGFRVKIEDIPANVLQFLKRVVQTQIEDSLVGTA